MFTKRITLSVILLVLTATAFVGCAGASDVPSTAGSTGSVDNQTSTNPVPPNGTPPNGTPPNSTPPGGMTPNSTSPGEMSPNSTTPGGMTPGGSGSSSSYVLSGVFTLDGQTLTQSDGTYSSNTTNVSAIYATNGSTLTLINPTIETTGDTTSNDDSSFYGLNAAVLANNGSTVRINGGTITTSGSGANGAFPSGTSSSIALSNVTIRATGNGGHGVMATLGGHLTLDDVNIVTTGTNSAPLATDRGGGTLTATGGTILASGVDSPGIYSTGTITVNDATITATGAEAAVVEGSNNITVTNATLTSAVGSRDRGIMLYQSMSGDAESGTGTFTMNGGSFTSPSTTGPAFYITNTKAKIVLTGATVTCNSGQLLNASAGSWGTTGSNGGAVTFVAQNETLNGSLVADSISSIDATLKDGTSLTGAVTSAALTLDATSTWNVTADSKLTGFTDPSGISGTTITNVYGNGHTVTYDPTLAANSALNGKTYTLVNGGTLTPSTAVVTTNATANTTAGNATTTATTTVTTGTHQPYSTHAVPGVIQAEDYDLGGEGVAYHDTTSGNEGGEYRHDDVDIEYGGTGRDVGWIRAGEWLTYSVSAATEGDYSLTLAAANPDNTAKTVTVSVDGTTSTTASIPSTGSFDTYSTVTAAGTVHLNKGSNVLKLAFDSSRLNLDYITIGSGTQPATTATTSGEAGFTVSPTSGKHSLTVSLTDTTIGGTPVSWSWNCGNGQTFTDKNVGINRVWYNTAGTYTITYTVTDADGSVRTASRTVTVT